MKSISNIIKTLNIFNIKQKSLKNNLNFYYLINLFHMCIICYNINKKCG
jgi:hypothetical protein